MCIMYSYLVSPLAATEVGEGRGRGGEEGRRGGEGRGDNLVWSGLDQDDMRIMYSYLVSPLASTEVMRGRGGEERGRGGEGMGEGMGGGEVRDSYGADSTRTTCVSCIRISCLPWLPRRYERPGEERERGRKKG